MKAHRLHIFLLVAAITLVVLVDVLTPKPIDWRTTYDRTDKIPFGSKILFDLLPDIFPKQSIRVYTETLYEQNDQLHQGNYLVITNSFNPGEQDLEILLELVANGSHAFIAADGFSQKFQDTLGIKAEYQFSMSDTIRSNLSHAQLKAKKPYSFTKINSLSFFTSKDSSKTTFQTLGTFPDGDPNFIRVTWGKGAFYLHTIPQVYTNYNMLAGNNAEYIAKSLSYLPLQPVYWQEYYQGNQHESRTPLRFIISTTPLRWALYISLLAVILFVIFEAKRRQRIIPIVTPLANTTLEFTQTVGQLYFQHKDHKNIAEKQITYFLEYLRTAHYTNAQVFDEALYERLVQKTGIPKADITRLFNLITFIRSQRSISETQLLDLTHQIERFEGKHTATKTLTKKSNTSLKQV